HVVWADNYNAPGTPTTLLLGTSAFTTGNVYTIYASAITDAPSFTVAPASLSFGSVDVGASKNDSVSVTNTGSSTLVIASVTSDNSQFTVAPTSGSIAPSATQKFTVTFTPTSTG